MKSPTLILLLASLMIFGGSGIARADVKIGTVDMNRVFTEYSKTKDAQAKYSEAEKAANDELNARVESLKKSMEEINTLTAAAQNEGLSKEAADAKKKDLQPKIDAARALDKEIADYRASKQKALQDKFLRMRKDIVEDIMKAVNDLVKAKAYDLVLDKSGLSSGAIPVVLYSRDDLDFSSEVLTALNKNAAAKSVK
jgi:outer membrane protein